MANYPEELAQDAAYQSHTSRLTRLWFLPKIAQGLNNNNNNNCECVIVALGIQHAMRMRHDVICSQPGFTIFFHVIT